MENNKSGLYKITNTENGRVYYGSAVNIARRWKEHRNALRRGAHYNDHLQRSWDKYGEDAFEFSVFAYCAVENLLENEQILLDLYVGKEDCYNIAKDAVAPFRGKKHTEETRAKLSAAMKGKPKSEEHRRKTSEAIKGKKHSEETKTKMSEAHLGKTLSEETKAKMSKNSARYWKGKTQSEESNRKRSEAMMGENNHNYGKTYRKVSCHYCGKVGGANAMKRYHFENCKQKD